MKNHTKIPQATMGLIASVVRELLEPHRRETAASAKGEE